MIKFQHLSALALVALCGISNIGLAKSDADTPSQNGYKVYQRDDGTCRIYQLKGDGTKVAGVRGDHLTMLEEVPDESGQIASGFIDRWFDRNELEDSGGDLVTRLNPKTDSCDRLSRLRDALNLVIRKNSPEPKKLDLLCFSPKKKFKFAFKLDGQGDLQSYVSYRIRKKAKTREHGTVLIQANEDAETGCELRIHDDEKLRLCLPKKNPGTDTFETEVTELSLANGKYALSEPMTVKCRASEKLYASNIIKKAIKRHDKGESETTLSDADFSSVDGENTESAKSSQVDDTAHTYETLPSNRDYKPLDLDDPFGIKAREQFPLFGTGVR